HPQARFLASQAARPFVICERNSLHIFCLGILLSVLGQLVLNEFFGGIPMQFAVSATGVAIMIGVAALMEWFAAAQGASGGRAVEAPPAERGARGWHLPSYATRSSWSPLGALDVCPGRWGPCARV